MSNDTPVTEEFMKQPHVAWDWLWIKHAQKLELKLTAAQAENAELRKVIQENIATIKTLSEQVGAASELRAKCEILKQGLDSIGTLTMSQVTSAAEGFQLCREWAVVTVAKAESFKGAKL